MAKLNVLFFANCVVLGYIGQSPLEAPFLFLGQLTTALYFLYFALCPVINYLDTLFVKGITFSDKNRVLNVIPNKNILHYSFTLTPLLFTNLAMIDYNVLFVVLSIIILGFSFIKYFSGYKKELIVALGLIVFSFIAPSIQYYLMLTLNIFVVFIALPYFTFLIPLKNKTIEFILSFLDMINIKEYFITIYNNRFSINTSVFDIQLFIIFAGGVFYVAISQYLFLHYNYLSQSNPLLLLAIYTLLFLCLTINQYRFVLSMSLFIATLLGKNIYLVDDLPPSTEKSPETPNQTSSSNNYSIFTVNKNYFNKPKNIGKFKWLGVALATCTLCLGTYAADQQRQQTEYQRQQTHEQRQQTYHTAREADVAAVDSGLISKEEYYRRHPEDDPSHVIPKKRNN